MTRRQRLGVAGVISGVLLGASVILAITYVLMSAALLALGQQFPPFVVHILSTTVGLLLCFVVLTALGRLFGSKERTARMGVFSPIIEALGKIAKGDFKIRLDSSFEQDGVLGELAKSVTNLAVELNQMEMMRQEFISNVSHEIQSPLTSIRGFAQALQDDNLSAESRCHYLTIIESESTRLSKLADNLLRLTTLESEHVRFEPKAYRLDKQIRDLILACEPQWLSKALEMDVALDEITLTADEDLLSQVWLNLIHNSIKFTPEGGSLRVTLRRDGGAVEFRLADSGIGISAEDQAHVFERFYKADKSRTRTREGSGLGLAIAHKIVSLHKGSISLTSQLNAGTTFVVRLPLG